jgi:hypothetical protein
VLRQLRRAQQGHGHPFGEADGQVLQMGALVCFVHSFVVGCTRATPPSPSRVGHTTDDAVGSAPYGPTRNCSKQPTAHHLRLAFGSDQCHDCLVTRSRGVATPPVRPVVCRCPSPRSLPPQCCRGRTGAAPAFARCCVGPRLRVDPRAAASSRGCGPLRGHRRLMAAHRSSTVQ